MALPYAVEHLTAAVTTLSATDAPLAVRLQRAWTESVQELWETMCLPADLNDRFRAMWHDYTQRSKDDPNTTTLRTMTDAELTRMAQDLVALALATVAADARGEAPAPNPKLPADG